MKAFFVSGAVALAMLVLAMPASAVTVNFQGDCLGSGTCDFDANRPFNNPTNCSPYSVQLYDWDFGDGSPHGSGSYVTHTYARPLSAYVVRLVVFCNFSPLFHDRPVCFAFGVPGCIFPGVGWN
jgi:hypothetical protein